MGGSDVQLLLFTPGQCRRGLYLRSGGPCAWLGGGADNLDMGQGQPCYSGAVVVQVDGGGPVFIAGREVQDSGPLCSLLQSGGQVYIYGDDSLVFAPAGKPQIVQVNGGQLVLVGCGLGTLYPSANGGRAYQAQIPQVGAAAGATIWSLWNYFETLGTARPFVGPGRIVDGGSRARDLAPGATWPTYIQNWAPRAGQGATLAITGPQEEEADQALAQVAQVPALDREAVEQSTRSDGRNLLTITDFGGYEGECGIRPGRRRSGDFAANSHGSGVG